MSTRSVIAKPNGDGWKGRYCHSDGYPTGVGAKLLSSYQDDFNGDLDDMIVKLIDTERMGWSYLCDTDLSMPGIWIEDYSMPYADKMALGPGSFTARGEVPPEYCDATGMWIKSDDANWCDTEWAYVLCPAGIFVHKIGYASAPQPVGFVPWTGTLLDMEAFEGV